MKRFALPGAIGLLLALGLHVAPAQAQLARTFVSSLGNDANDCGRPTPCRTFQRAGNTAGWLAIGGATVRSHGNNNIDGNANSEAAPTAIPPK
jgi:hypothetical protein